MIKDFCFKRKQMHYFKRIREMWADMVDTQLTTFSMKKPSLTADPVTITIISIL